MNKTLLSLALLMAFAGTASAQSSITIYGSVDLGIAKTNSGTAYNTGAPAPNTWQMQEANASRLGFRGTEDLGGGYSAQFDLQTRFKPDTGSLSNPNALWHARSIVQLTKADLGSVYLGREITPAVMPALLSDPFGWDTVGKMDIASWGNNGTGGYLTPATNGNGIRSNNTIGYKSPNLNGLTFNIAYALDENAGLGRNLGGNVQFTRGPVYAAMAYEKISGGTFDNQGLVSAALHYDFGMAKILGYVSKIKWGAGGANNTDFFSIGASIPAMNGTIKALYFVVRPDGDLNDSKKLGLGFDYPLSKRTMLYTDVGHARAEGKTNSTAFDFGVKHSF